MNNESTEEQSHWLSTLQRWQYAYGTPTVSGVVKQSPIDFVVTENMEVEPIGEGEHVWLLISKERQNTEQVAKALARHANVAYRDVGYSGMKDLFAITEQWFSVWLPNKTDASGNKEQEPSWDDFEMLGVQIKQAVRHQRKIKRGTHKSNHFEIVVRELVGDTEELERRLVKVKDTGVPNYFGEQRFGRGLNNMLLADAHLVHGKSIKNRNLKGIVLSAARSWLFNEIVSARVANKSWQTLYAGEPANLNGSGSCFNSNDESSENLAQRLIALDIHPTAPLWGRGWQTEQYKDLQAFEMDALSIYQPLITGLEKAGLGYQRRPLRVTPCDFRWKIKDNDLELSFSLQRGQFATSVLRELVRESVVK